MRSSRCFDVTTPWSVKKIFFVVGEGLLAPGAFILLLEGEPVLGVPAAAFMAAGVYCSSPPQSDVDG